MEIVFIDNHMLAADKPHNLLTQPSGTDRDSLEAQAKLFIKNEFHKPGNVFLEAVHRIDRQACGIVLFARTSKALSRLTEQIRNGSCRKIYRALVTGRLPQTEGVLEDWLVHDDFKAAVVPAGSDGAKRATLRYRLLETRTDGHSLLENLTSFQAASGGFSHVQGGDVSAYSTEQAMRALVDIYNTGHMGVTYYGVR